MKKKFILFIAAVLCVLMFGCANSNVKNTVEGNIKTYSQMTDDTWLCDNYSYKYRLEIKGRLNNAVKDSVYVYLSNIPEISFEQAWQAAGLSSNTNDYFEIKDAVLVEMK